MIAIATMKIMIFIIELIRLMISAAVKDIPCKRTSSRARPRAEPERETTRDKSGNSSRDKTETLTKAFLKGDICTSNERSRRRTRVCLPRKCCCVWAHLHKGRWMRAEEREEMGRNWQIIKETDRRRGCLMSRILDEWNGRWLAERQVRTGG